MKYHFLLFCLIAGANPTIAMESPSDLEPASVTTPVQEYKIATQEFFEKEVRSNPFLWFSRVPQDISNLIKNLLPAHEEIQSSKKAINESADIGAAFIKLREIESRRYTVSQDAAKMLARKYKELIHATFQNGRTLLHDKVSDGATFEVELLLLAGAPANQGTSDNNITPLYMACQTEHNSIVNLLIAAKADVNEARTPDGTTPLFLASFHGHMAIASLLIAANANPNKARTDDNRTPLFPSCFFGYSPIVKQLLKAGADANHKRTTDDATPLHIAAQRNKVACVKLLLKHGANPTLKMNDGKTARDIAQEKGHKEVALLLQKAENRA